MYATYDQVVSSYGALAFDRSHSHSESAALRFDTYLYGAGKSLTPFLSLGIAVRYTSVELRIGDLVTAEVHGLGLDAGVLISLGDKLSLGVSCAGNDGNISWSDTSLIAPCKGGQWRVGLSLSPLHALRLNIQADNVLTSDCIYRLGAEVSLSDVVYVLGGIVPSSDRQVVVRTAGAGLEFMNRA